MATWSNRNFRDVQSTDENQENIIIQGDTVYFNGTYNESATDEKISDAVAAIDTEGITTEVINFCKPSEVSGIDTNGNLVSHIQISSTSTGDLIIGLG